MKARTKTYRIFSALTLMLLLSTIMVPATISAASLFCNMEMSSAQGEVQACCTHLTVDHLNDHAASTTDSNCSFQKACEHTLSERHTDIKAVQKVAKEIVVVTLSKKLLTFSTEEHQPVWFPTESSVIKFAPPIFLLNSTFLN